MQDESFLQELGGRIRRLRVAADLSLGDLAQKSGLSRRYLTETEAGRANISILKLVGLARALKQPLATLCDIELSRGNSRRIALIGLRGAGKSTVGRELAYRLERPFVELDSTIEERAGFDLTEIFNLHGEEYYRVLERESLEHELERSGEVVIATGGSIVSHSQTYARLLETCFTVWLRADPKDHWDRVVAQGDTRPMRANPRAKEELEKILEQRESAYRRAALTVQTSGKSVDEVLAEIVGAYSQD